MFEELAPKCETAWQSALRERRGGDRRQAAGAGPKQRLVLTDRLLVTLVHLRLGLPHAALARLYGMDRSTVSRAKRVSADPEFGELVVTDKIKRLTREGGLGWQVEDDRLIGWVEKPSLGGNHHGGRTTGRHRGGVPLGGVGVANRPWRIELEVTALPEALSPALTIS
ncbi:helix-turn-helix domain-containing protein [Kitasatospora acidiphila]|uniref:helix-turn-helix domain-containing protein n=1 Tax=Kitasatospora acidiphila TaxID=2567942 RepID=UPI003C712146